MTRPQRVADWPKRLHEYIETYREIPFAWGTNDCATFAIGALLTLTDTTYADWPSIPVHDGRVGAGKLLLRMPLGDWAATVLGAPLASPLLAQRGDIVLHTAVDQEFEAGLAVCYGPGHCAPSKTGLLFSPNMRFALQAWRV